MKSLLVLIVFMAPFYILSHDHRAIQHKTSAPSISADTISFKDEIQPILVKRCSPCHFAGGKMYARLPFDTAVTIINHSEMVLRRIKDEKQNLLIKGFITQQLSLKNSKGVI